VRDAGRLHVLEGDRFSGVFGADRPAQETVSVEHPDLAQIAGVVPDGHRDTDVGGQDRAVVAQSFEPDAVAVHGTRRGDHDQQQVKSFETVRQPAVGQPGLLGRDTGFTVRAPVKTSVTQVPIAVSSCGRVNAGGLANVPDTRCPGSSGSSSVVIEPMIRPTLPRP
jgi:hypothetical protein